MLKDSSFNKTVEKTVHFPYAVYTPEGYDGSKPYPLLIFLHGAGERGEDPSLLWRYGFLNDAQNGKSFPFLIVAPHITSKNKYWGNYTESLNIFLDGILETYNVDKSRIYLTGLSMGGTGTWHWLMANPERFAAAAPVCGTGVYWFACQVTKTPLWVFHGDNDEIVPATESISMVENIKKFGGEPKLTIFEGVGHDAWRYAYTDELVNWFMEHKKSKFP